MLQMNVGFVGKCMTDKGSTFKGLQPAIEQRQAVSRMGRATNLWVDCEFFLFGLKF